MSDETNAVSAAALPQVELKSIDTLNKPVEVVNTPAPAEESVKAEKPVDTPVEGDDDDAAAADATVGKKSDRLPRWMQERLKRAEEQGRNKALKELMDSKPEKAPEAKQEPVVEKVKSLEDFDFDVGAYAEYKAEQVIQKREEEAKKAKAKEAEEAKATEFKKKIDSFEERVGAGAWEDIVESPVNKDPKFKPVVELFQDSEKMLEIAHFLATNPEEATRLADLPRHRMVSEVGKLIDRYEEGVSAPQIPVNKVSKAPPPPETIVGAGKAKVDIYSNEQSTADRIKAWRAKKSS